MRPARADGQLEGVAFAGEPGEELDRWSEHLGRGHRAERVVVAGRDPAAKWFSITS